MSMGRKAREPVSWPAWRFGPNGESQIFNYAAEVPDGWTTQPGIPYVPVGRLVLDKDELIDQLERLNITVDPRWSAAHMKKVIDDSSTSR